MADLKVQQVQEWLLSTYRNQSKFAAFVSETGFEANGLTDNTTMTALIYALQYELGISDVTGSFGPTTLRLAPRINLSNAGNYPKNIIRILEGGLWCHGYNAGYNESFNSFGGTYDSDTDVAVKELQNDIGTNPSGNFDGYLWKALLSTDAYVTTWSNGSEKLREAQQYLNGLAINGYFFTDDFIGGYLPTDGLNSRQFNSALIYYLQAVMGMYASEATGFIGDATKAGLITVPDNLPDDVTTARHYVRAIVFALLANGYDLTINSYWSEETAAAIAQFQRDMALPVTGKVDVTTWMALLVSYGDKNRPYAACDTRFEITESRLETLKAMGIQAVGRYINGTEFKVLRSGEVERIINGGLGLIPIYQENGTNAIDFSNVIGRSQAVKAAGNARKFGIPYDSIIYFAVDYDAQDWEIAEYILPYFKGVSEALTNFRVGVYGTRNVCSQVTSAGYAVTSYVSNMSSGFSGNLGFRMPSNWNFDQFDEIEIDDWGIDKVVYSGLYPVVGSLTNRDSDEQLIKDALARVTDGLPLFTGVAGRIELDGEEKTLFDDTLIRVTFSASADVAAGDDEEVGNTIFVYNYSKMDSSVENIIKNNLGLSNQVKLDAEGITSTLASNIFYGKIESSVSVQFREIMYTYKVILYEIELLGGLTTSASITFNIYLKNYNLPPRYQVPADIQDKVIQVSHEAYQGVSAAQVISGGLAIIAAGAFLLYVGPAIITAIPTIMEGLIAAMGIILNTQPAM
ncbi:Peptidoglycan-binding (PGRP) domain of peptidoglycan hydrolases-containing protein [Trichococcus flocculiformis]|uniref:glycoside hydrolase domain-containing protein n=1 Tax=Trichococcus TaxID=82802 RepID=UPI0007A84C2F|nr:MULTISPECIES: glycoside hydrolase domain-containing protein [Trichococcus]CZR10885.1 Hypothetical protein TES5_2953 [Trichococcus sp. ES5]SHG27594.1 Peptidoglycan-binding (PGRP) domain of peptidoglycan hydrolases-containing protein [Trichococcus flocculiformis]